MRKSQIQMTNDKEMKAEIPMTKGGNGKIYDIRERSLQFAVDVAKMVGDFPKHMAGNEYGKQLVRASASIGANVEEADGAISRKDFVNKMAIGRREAREARYWLRLIQKIDLVRQPQTLREVARLAQEAEELLLVLSSIIRKAQGERR